MTYSQLREEIEKRVAELSHIYDADHNAKKETTDAIMTAIDTYLEEKAVEVATIPERPCTKPFCGLGNCSHKINKQFAYKEAAAIIRSKE